MMVTNEKIAPKTLEIMPRRPPAREPARSANCWVVRLRLDVISAGSMRASKVPFSHDTTSTIKNGTLKTRAVACEARAPPKRTRKITMPVITPTATMAVARARGMPRFARPETRGSNEIASSHASRRLNKNPAKRKALHSRI